jgi:two-component system, OmpR family, response regulator VanR
MKILVVDDERAVRESLRRALELEGYQVALAEDGEEALERLGGSEEGEADAIILDVLMPGIDGLEVCRRLRADRNAVPVLMLTARAEVDSRVAGLDAGADDYLPKPFAMAELIARIQALGRRPNAVRLPVIAVGDLQIDTNQRNARRGYRDLNLTRKEFGVLEVLAGKPGDVVSAEELLEKVWDEEADPFTNAVRITIMTLRRKLGEPQPIETVIGVGYRLLEQP